jgi:hypothetical protein
VANTVVDDLDPEDLADLVLLGPDPMSWTALFKPLLALWLRLRARYSKQHER